MENERIWGEKECNFLKIMKCLFFKLSVLVSELVQKISIKLNLMLVQ